MFDESSNLHVTVFASAPQSLVTIDAFIIVNNVNQQSNRAQLRDAATMIADIVSEEVDVFQHSIDNELTQISSTLEYYNSPEKADEYLNKMKNSLSFYKELSIVKPSKMKEFSRFDYDKNVAIFDKELKNGDVFDSFNDHRIAMSMAILATILKTPSLIKNAE